MRVTTSLLAAVSVASAFLIPPEIFTDELGDIVADFESLTEELYTQGNQALNVKTLVGLGCDGCYGLQKEDGTLILDIEMGKNTLMINGAPVIPLPPFQHSIELTVPMIKQDHSILDYALLGTDDSLVDVDVHLGYDLLSTTVGDHKTINLKLNVGSVDGRDVPVGHADDVGFTIYEDEKTGELYILSLDVNREAPKALKEDKFTCAGLFCSLKEMMEQHFESVKDMAEAQFNALKSKFGGKKGCHGKTGSPAALPDPAHRRPHSPDHGIPHSMHYFYEADDPDSSKRLTFREIFNQVIYPIFVGIIAGLSVSLVGIFVGHLIVTVYQHIKKILLLCSRRQRQAQEDSETGEDESEKGLLAGEERTSEEQDAPPCYRDVEESVNVVVVDSAEEKQ